MENTVLGSRDTEGKSAIPILRNLVSCLKKDKKVKCDRWKRKHVTHDWGEGRCQGYFLGEIRIDMWKQSWHQSANW